MNRQLLYGRELTVIFAEENRKKPADMRNKERMRGRGMSEVNGGSYYSHRGRSRTRSRSQTPLRGHRYSRSPSYEERTHDLSPQSPAGAPSVDRHHHRSRRHEFGRSGSESRRYGGERSLSGSPVSPASRHSQKVNRHESYSDAQRTGREHSHSSPYVHPESPPRHSGKGRRRSPSPSGGASPERYSRSLSMSPPPQRGHTSRYSHSQSRSPPENQSQDGSEDRGASPERSPMDD